MKIKQIGITNLRAIERLEIDFHPSVTLIVGVNGVGKSTVLDAIRVCGSRILPPVTKSAAKAMSFSTEDIRITAPFVDVDVTFEHDSKTFRYTRMQWTESFATDDAENIESLKRKILNTERLRDRPLKLLRELDDSLAVSDTDYFFPPVRELKKSVSASTVAPNIIFFSTSRSVISDGRISKSKALQGPAAAYAEALSPRPLYVLQFAEWMHAQATLSKEWPLSRRHLDVMRSAVSRFLPTYQNLHPNVEGKPKLLIQKGEITLDVRQLSDGERGILALVLEIAKRLSQANPKLDDPLADGEAIILIDEIDLHLHPTWQRQILRNLTMVFPKCQVIATTHSPQVVSAVDPEQVLLFTNGGVERPQRSLGMDSNWILRYLMDAGERPSEAAQTIHQIEQLIEAGKLKKARTAIALAKKEGWDFPEWSVLEARMARLELLAK